MLAALTADAGYMKTLVELGADPELRNDENSTALMAAAGLGTRSPGEDAGTEAEVLEAMQVALELGADVNAVDNNFETPMHGAAYKNLPKAVEFLAEHGADIEIWNQQNKFGWTPLTIARGYRFGNFKPSPVTEAVGGTCDARRRCGAADRGRREGRERRYLRATAAQASHDSACRPEASPLILQSAPRPLITWMDVRRDPLGRPRSPGNTRLDRARSPVISSKLIHSVW